MEALSIFVLEDDTNLRELLCETLEDEGYQVGSAGSGREAVEKVAGADFDLLIVDVRMEGMSGLDAFAVLKQQGIDIPCLVITGYATEEDSIRAIRLGVGDYLRKPFDMRQFLLCVRRLTAHYVHQRATHLRQRQLEHLLEWVFSYWGQPGPQVCASLRVVRALAWALGFEKHEQLQIELALLLPPGPPPAPLPHFAAEAAAYAQERWDGRGPQGLSGEDIPLSGRLLRLARQVGTEAGTDGLDPFLFEQWRDHLRQQDNQETRVRRLLGLARTLLETGDGEGALAAVQEAEPLASGGQSLQVRLLRLHLLPESERLAWAHKTLQGARLLGAREEGPVLAELAIALSRLQPVQAQEWLEESLSKLSDSGLKSKAWLALWTMRGSSLGSPAPALQTLLSPAHEGHLSSSLPWLWSPLIDWWISQAESLDNGPPLLLLRRYNSLLQAAVGHFSKSQRRWLARLLTDHKWGQSLLQQLSQDPEDETRNLALSALRAPGRDDKSAATPLLRIRSLGTLEVSVGGEPIPEKAWRGTRNKYLLAYLAAAGRPVSEDRIIDLFWDEDQEKGKRGLYNALYCLRKILHPLGWQGELDYIQRNRGQIGLNPSADHWHDMGEFEKALATARRRRADKPLESLRQTCALYQGPFLDNCFMDWALEQRTRLEQEAISAFLWLAQLEQEVGEPQLALDAAQRALALDDCSQPAILSVMRAFIGLKRPEESIRTYESATRRLKSEFEIEPSLELFEAYQRARLLF